MRPVFERPIIFNYNTIPEYIDDMLAWKRTRFGFTVSGYVRRDKSCSRSLVTSVAKGSRRMTRDRVPDFARMLDLTEPETRYLDTWVRYPQASGAPSRSYRKPIDRLSDLTPQNRVCNHWLHVFVKDSCQLRGFRNDAATVHRLLGGIASVEDIKKSLEFLIENGFLKKNRQGKFVPAKPLTFTTDGVPDSRLRDFHKKSADLTKLAIDQYPTKYRHNDAFVLTLNKREIKEIKKILSNCTDQIERYREENPGGDEMLYEVTLNLTPIGGSHGH